MKINLMDPGLWRLAGHHFDIDLKVARQLVADGHALTVYTRTETEAPVLRAFEGLAEVLPLFRVGPYRQPAQVDPIAGELLMHQQSAPALATDLAKARPADLWLWPSIFANQLEACALANRGVPVAGCVHTEPDPWESGIGPMLWRQAFLTAQRRKLNLRIGGIEPEHRHAYLPLTADERFEILPIPHDGKPIEAPRSALRTIGFLGHQRGEKGAALLPGLSKQLLADGFKVMIQDSGSALRALEHPQVTRLGYVEDITDAILQCDLVVLPYTPARYRIKGSGILWEAIASGIPVVAPFATAPGHWIERTGAGTLFMHGTEQSIRQAVLSARDTYARIAGAAFAVSRAWSDTQGVRHFIREMIKPVPTAATS